MPIFPSQIAAPTAVGDYFATANALNNLQQSNLQTQYMPQQLANQNALQQNAIQQGATTNQYLPQQLANQQQIQANTIQQGNTMNQYLPQQMANKNTMDNYAVQKDAILNGLYQKYPFLAGASAMPPGYAGQVLYGQMLGNADPTAGNAVQQHNALANANTQASIDKNTTLANTRGFTALSPLAKQQTISQLQNLGYSAGQIPQILGNGQFQSIISNNTAALNNPALSSTAGTQSDQTASSVDKSIYSQNQINRINAGTRFETVAQQYQQLLPSVASYTGIAGQAQLKADQAKAALGQITPSYQNYLNAKNIGALLYSDAMTLTGTRGTDQAAKDLQQAFNVDQYLTTPQAAVKQFNASLGVVRATEANNKLTTNQQISGEGGTSQAQSGAISAAASQSSMVNIMNPKDGKTYAVPQADVAAALAAGGKRA